MSGTANSDKLLKIGATDASNPNNQWSETVVLPVAGGIYSHYLGTITPLNPLNFNGPVYLNIRVGGKDLLPRTEFTYAPFSFSTTYSQKVVCSGAVGDIKYSILPPDKFKNVNGDCWVPLDGRTLATTDELYSLGVTTLPNAGGMFLRAQDFNAVSGLESWKPRNSSNNDPERDHSTFPGSLQSDMLGTHNHIATSTSSSIVNDPGHSHSLDLDNASGDCGIDDAGNSTEPCQSQSTATATTGITVSTTTTTTIFDSGGSETRPKNLNFWIYIRIN